MGERPSRSKRCIFCGKAHGTVFVAEIASWIHSECVEAAQERQYAEEREARRHRREETRKNECPTCGAAPGARCVGIRGKPRAANHKDRSS